MDDHGYEQWQLMSAADISESITQKCHNNPAICICWGQTSWVYTYVLSNVPHEWLAFAGYPKTGVFRGLRIMI